MKRALSIMVLGLVLVCSVAFASVGIMGGTDGSPIGVATNIYFNTGFSGSTFDGSIYTANVTTGAVASITSGTINGATIGASSATTGKFSSVASNATIGAYKLAVDGAVYFKPSSLTAAAAGGSRMGLNTDGSVYIY